MIASGNIVVTIILVLMLGLTQLIIMYQKKGTPIKLRKLAGLDAIDEAVGRGTETGRPVHFTTGGRGSLYTEEGPQILAGLSVLSYIARLTARNRTKLIVSVGEAASLPLQEETIREAYAAEGRLEDFSRDMIRYLTGETTAFTGGVQGIILREKVAANIVIGPLYADTLALLEAGFRVGAIQVGGTGTKTVQLPFLVAVADYTLIGEEIYACGAYLTKDQKLTATIRVQDIAKMAVLALLVIGTIFAFFTTAFTNLLRL